MSAGQDANIPRIVVGVDGSPSANAAVRWAVRQARLTGGTVDAVIAWQGRVPIGGFGMVPMAMYKDTNLDQSAEKILAHAITQAVDPDSDMTVREQVLQGDPTKVLIAAAQDADLLVLGSRGHSELSDTLLDSVSQHCVRHAPCPVVIVRG